jgi:3-oxoadipate enol-lactonase
MGQMRNGDLIATNGAKLAVQIDGDLGRPWLVLSNSLATTYDSWRRQMPLLTGTYRVLRYDTRGHGRSSAPAGSYAFDVLVDDVVRLMDHFDIQRADFMGLSLGGMTGLGLAIHHPDRIGRLICCAARADAPAPVIDIWNARIATINDGGIETEVASSLNRWFTPACRHEQPGLLEEAAAMIRATDSAAYIACAEALKTLDYKRLLGRIQSPSLFVAGAQDPAAPSAIIKEMASLVTGAEYCEIGPGAHLFAMENPQAFNAAVARWLNI